MLYETLAMLKTFGTPTWFMTVSAADYQGPKKRDITLQKMMYITWIGIPSHFGYEAIQSLQFANFNTDFRLYTNSSSAKHILGDCY